MTKKKQLRATKKFLRIYFHKIYLIPVRRDVFYFTVLLCAAAGAFLKWPLLFSIQYTPLIVVVIIIASVP